MAWDIVQVAKQAGCWRIVLACTDALLPNKVFYRDIQPGSTYDYPPEGKLSAETFAIYLRKPMLYVTGFGDALDKVQSLITQAIEEETLSLRNATALGASRYPEVPGPMWQVASGGSPLPKAPGVYFLWVKGEITYVGQSRNLKSRINFGHGHTGKGASVSWLEMPRSELNFAEAFYIGLLRPPGNFGNGKRKSA